ncbi:MAG: hypothetical protein IJT73_08080 [Selenomonadaceae bacterium]|nr:hypothetical protein [Selenomonadaceae bacterium]
MWIKTCEGVYLNSDLLNEIYIAPSKIEGYIISAIKNSESRPRLIAEFNAKEDAQNYLDRMMKGLGTRIWEIDMGDWNYTGHKKDHKETRHGGS